jgi:hypothetical protein
VTRHDSVDTVTDWSTECCLWGHEHINRERGACAMSLICVITACSSRAGLYVRGRTDLRRICHYNMQLIAPPPPPPPPPYTVRQFLFRLRILCSSPPLPVTSAGDFAELIRRSPKQERRNVFLSLRVPDFVSLILFIRRCFHNPYLHYTVGVQMSSARGTRRGSS